MHCPRLDHFVRLEPNGKIGKCGHMVSTKKFDTFEEMQDSDWLQNIRKTMRQGRWPEECIRCKKTESINGRSIRLDMIERDKILRPINKNYMIVGGVLDNICNSACQTCNANLSTKIGSLEQKNYLRFENSETFNKLPLDRIIELDINGGEPTVSPNYRKILDNPPPNTKIIRINTNGHKPFRVVEDLLLRHIRVIMTVSFDGIDKVHDYVRWPIKFEQTHRTIQYYQTLCKDHDLFRLNLWTTVSCLNINDLENIMDYAKQNNIDHEFGLLEHPTLFSIEHQNIFNLKAKQKYINHINQDLNNISKHIAIGKDNSNELEDFMNRQDFIRKINFADYFNL